MPSQFSHNFFPLGDSALLICFGSGMDEATNREVIRVFRLLQSLQLPFVTDLVPAFASLTVHFSSAALQRAGYEASTGFEALVPLLEDLLQAPHNAQPEEERLLSIPVCYEPPFALDLDSLALEKGMEREQLIALHTATIYRVYMLGFLPGFAYMGAVDERLAARRKTEPRKEVPAGSVGIAGRQTGIYPLASPGGWQIVGRTPLLLFDAAAAEPVRLQPGDRVQFYSITAHEFAHHQNRPA